MDLVGYWLSGFSGILSQLVLKTDCWSETALEAKKCSREKVSTLILIHNAVDLGYFSHYVDI